MNKHIKKVCCAVLAAAMTAALAGCGGETTASQSSASSTTTPSAGGSAAVSGDVDYSSLPKTTVILASSQSSSLNASVWLQNEADKISQLTGGQLTIQLQFDGKLGGDTEEIEAVQAGDIDLMLLSSSALLTFVPEIAVFDMPMMFDDADTAVAAIPQFTNDINELTTAKGIQTLGLGLSSFRALSTNTNIQTPADFSGMKIRTLENKYHMDFWENLGAEPTPIAFTDLYLSLSQGLVDAQDNNIETILAMKFNEVQKYYMDITAFLNVSMIISNPNKFASLDPAYQALIQEFVDNFMANAYSIGMESADAAREQIGDDMTDLEYSDEIKAAMLEAARPVWDSIRKDIGDTLPDAYMKLAGRA